MEKVVLPGDPPIELVVNNSGRARRLSLRVSQLDGRVTLTLPRGMRRQDAIAFAREKEGWLRQHLARRPDDIRPKPGGSLPFEGILHLLVAGPVRAPRLGLGVIELPQSGVEKSAARLAAFLRHKARDRLSEATERHADRLGRAPAGLTLRDTRSRWGSCSPEGRLMFSWRLIMAPPEVLDYVAAHEVAHLAHMNHSPAFWAEVAGLFPGYQVPRHWLKKHGASLHRYRFRN
jgi:predicted metal-dependent hydrolase